MAAIVLKRPHPDGQIGTLFAGQSFWVSANVPQRARFKELIQINGGTVVLLEKDADIKLVDHAKQNNPLNTHSYKFIEKSIANGQLEDLEDHRVGQHVRPVGAVGIPSRGSRIPYTLEDDQILWEWMQPYEKRKDPVAGNLIYQQLASQYPRHTFQSWRDRYLKKLQGKPRPGGPVEHSAAEPTASQDVTSQGQSNFKSAMVETSVRKHTPLPNRPPGFDTTRASNHSEQKAASSRLSKANSPVVNQDKNRNIDHTKPSYETTNTKRKRLSQDGTSTLSNFEIDNALKKRRVTDLVPRSSRRSSTPVHRNQDVSKNRSRSHTSSLNVTTTSDESHELTQFETAPQYPLSTPETQTQLQPMTASQVKQQENFQALMDLPYPVGTTYSAEDTAFIESEGIEEWIRARIEDGQKGEHVLLALSCTSMNPELADQILKLLSSGKEIPNNMRGVWTEQDDRDLLGTDGRAITRLNDKHGPDLFRRRHDYLRDTAEVTRLIAEEEL